EADLFRLGARAHREARRGCRTPGRDRDRGRPRALAEDARRGVRIRFRERRGGARGDRPRARQAGRRALGSAGDRILSADDRRV
ncbi:MAG: Molybdopterin synthase sulfur carrier subunit, partial [uncultured Microvirga sp.]